MLTLWNPRGLSDLRRELDELFDFDRTVSLGVPVDVEEYEDRFVLTADLPGMTEKDIEVKVEDGVLTLSGQRDQTKESTDKARRYRERRFGSFERRFTLGPAVDAAKIEAKYNNGVLTLELPRKEETKPRQITVRTN